MVVSGHTGSVVKFIVLISIVLQKYESTFGLSSQKGSLLSVDSSSPSYPVRARTKL